MDRIYEFEERAYKALEDLADEYREAGRQDLTQWVESLQDTLWEIIKGANND